MTDNELLLALSDMMDKKLDARLAPIENRLDRMENKITAISSNIENNVVPQLDNITSYYTDTYDRYKDHSDRMEAVFDDVELLKKVVSEHSQKLQNIS
ncbi:hypothetical protein D7V86_13375 [bacterium D16-51]|nr:hypothetical protein D7V96_17095 [bacterium D16-59]RKI59335.1 hypothetical protein D7V86_13375 [bacterium D16-51]